MSSVYDALVERYADSGELDSLPGDGQAPRNFIHSLRDSGAAPEEKRESRERDHVDDPPAGEQTRLDLGQEKREGGLTVHFLCPLLRRSRCLGVHAQDHKLDSAEACTAIYRFLRKIGGRAGSSSTGTARSWPARDAAGPSRRRCSATSRPSGRWACGPAAGPAQSQGAPWKAS